MDLYMCTCMHTFHIRSTSTKWLETKFRAGEHKWLKTKHMAGEPNRNVWLKLLINVSDK